MLLADILFDIIVIFGLAVIVISLGNQLRIPTIVGFLLTGIIVGPSALGVIPDAEMTGMLADIGVIFLLFTIGMQFSFKKLYQMKRDVLIGGSLQVALTIIAVVLVVQYLQVPFALALFLGFLICHSSTSLTFKVFQERAEVTTPHAQTTLAISLFQDLMSIPMIISLPLLAGSGGEVSSSLLGLGMRFFLLIGLVLFIAQYVVPKVLNQITGSRNPELFLLSIIMICFIITWATANLGLSLALGAFLAGLTISESEYFYQAFATVLPFRDIFTSFFFISIGMLLNVGFFMQNPLLIVGLAIAVLLGKATIAGATSLLLGHPLRTSVLVGLGLSNIGEFAFVLSVAGISYGIFAGGMSQLFLSVAVITMASTPLVMAAGPRAADAACRLPLPGRAKPGCLPIADPDGTRPSGWEKIRDHMIIIGFGVNGRNLAKAAKAGKIPYVIIEMNPRTVRAERVLGEPIFYGDATNEAILNHGSIKSARIVVIVINDPEATRAITRLARRLNPSVHIIVRTPFVKEMRPLRDLGADEVITDEIETSAEIFTRVLKKYLVPRDQIEQLLSSIRSDQYLMSRNLSESTASVCDLPINLPGEEISALVVNDTSKVQGMTLAELMLRSTYAVSVLAIRRGTEIIPNPDGASVLYPGDIAIVIGTPERVSRVAELFNGHEG
jgi:monovalent cation:H+ antiporter-2, CPA2 family